MLHLAKHIKEELGMTLYRKYQAEFIFYPATSHKSLGLVEQHMSNIHNLIGTLDQSNSEIDSMVLVIN